MAFKNTKYMIVTKIPHAKIAPPYKFKGPIIQNKNISKIEHLEDAFLYF